MAANQDTGLWGEQKAAAYLVAQGYEIVQKNYRSKHLEVDLIGIKDQTLVFVEVKTRSGNGFGMPEEFVNVAKAKRIMKAAEYYIFDTDWQYDIRFDIISIIILPTGKIDLHHIQDAFSR